MRKKNKKDIFFVRFPQNIEKHNEWRKNIVDNSLEPISIYMSVWIQVSDGNQIINKGVKYRAEYGRRERNKRTMRFN